MFDITSFKEQNKVSKCFTDLKTSLTAARKYEVTQAERDDLRLHYFILHPMVFWLFRDGHTYLTLQGSISKSEKLKGPVCQI